MTMELPSILSFTPIHSWGGQERSWEQRNILDRSPLQQLRQHKHINRHLKAIYSFVFTRTGCLRSEGGKWNTATRAKREHGKSTQEGLGWVLTQSFIFSLSTTFVLYSQIMFNLNLCCEVIATEPPCQAVAVVVFSPHWATGRLHCEQVASLS